MILMDTDICIEILRGKKSVIEERAKCEESVAISFMTVGELYYGAERSKNRIKNIAVVDEFILSLLVINPDVEILKKFGELKSKLYKNNILLPDADILSQMDSKIELGMAAGNGWLAKAANAALNGLSGLYWRVLCTILTCKRPVRQARRSVA